MKRLIREIHSGKNLDENLRAYKVQAVRTYQEYAALELTFSAYTMVQELVEERRGLAQEEKRVAEAVLAVLGELGGGGTDYAGMAGKMRMLRQEVTDKMDLFTAYTDRLIVYEYVLNRMELKYLPADELDKRLAAFDEEAYMQRLSSYLFAGRDQAVIREKMHMVMGQVPIHMTKNKLFERIGEAMTLYRNGDRRALDDFVYMLRTAAMVYEPQKYVGEYPVFETPLERLARADYTNMPEETYDAMTALLEGAAREIHAVTDFYYSLQKVVNGIYAMCLVLPYQEGANTLVKACRSIWACLAKKQYRDEMLMPLEGRIEEGVEKSSYLESVLFEIKSSYREDLGRLGMAEFISDFALVANLLSDSLFIDLDSAADADAAVADAAYVQKCTEELLDELSGKLGSVPRPVKRAIMGQILEKLPLAMEKPEEVTEYIRSNLFGCHDKAERCVVMTLLWEMLEQ